jgi:hypothetical protein
MTFPRSTCDMKLGDTPRDLAAPRKLLPFRSRASRSFTPIPLKSSTRLARSRRTELASGGFNVITGVAGAEMAGAGFCSLQLPPPNLLLTPQVLCELLVLKTDELDQVGVWHDPLVDSDRPRPSIGFRIIDRNLDF